MHKIAMCAITLKESSWLCSIHTLYSLRHAKIIKIAKPFLLNFSNPKRGLFKGKIP